MIATFSSRQSKSVARLISASLGLMALLATTISLTESASAAAVRIGVFNANTLLANDDGSTGAVGIGFSIDFFGSTYSDLFVNNNGNVTFNAALGTFTPFNLLSTSTPIIAPFFADVDTRGSGSGIVSFGTGTVDGRTAFGVNWPGVGYFSNQTDKLNTFQLVLIDRSDTGAGNFDIEFNYDQIQWETGDASSGDNGLGGFSARVGYSNGVNTAFELPGSAINGAFLDGGSNSLIANRLNSTVDGRYVFQARNGTVVNPDSIPTPALLPGLVGMGAMALRKRKAEAVEQESEA